MSWTGPWRSRGRSTPSSPAWQSITWRTSASASCSALLAPGGVFANLDLVSSASPQLHERFRREIGRAEDDPTDRLAGLAEQLQWLRDAGFAEVECHFKWLELALVVAVIRGPAAPA